MQDVRPVDPWYLPLPHDMQLECPDEGWYCPELQEEQELDDPEDPLYFPLPQEMQLELPDEGWNFPELHSVQELEDPLYPL